jgi:hypothetical protein
VLSLLCGEAGAAGPGVSADAFSVLRFLRGSLDARGPAFGGAATVGLLAVVSAVFAATGRSVTTSTLAVAFGFLRGSLLARGPSATPESCVSVAALEAGLRRVRAGFLAFTSPAGASTGDWTTAGASTAESLALAVSASGLRGRPAGFSV